MESPAFLAGGGEMGARIRSFDWGATALGSVDRWPQSLRSALSILLPSKAQIVLFWGDDLITLYNDAYCPVLGAKHPAGLGAPVRDVWSEVWLSDLKPLFDGVVTTGEAFWEKDRLFALERHGYREETYFDVSYDPVRDESGRVGGVFCIVSETTGRVVDQRRLNTLRELGRIPESAASVAEVYERAAAVLSANDRDVPFALLYGIDADTPARLRAAFGLVPGSAAAPLEIRDAKSWPLSDSAVVLAGSRLDRFGELRAGPWPEPVQEVAILPFASAGHPQGWLVAGISARRRFDKEYEDFLRLLAAGIGAAAATVKRTEDERRRAEGLAQLDRAKTLFFSNVSHELRTPLTLMLSPLEDVLAHRELLPPRDAESLDIAHRNSLRLLKLVNSLLDFSRIEAGRVEALYEPVDLAALTEELAGVFRSAIEGAGLTLSVDCAPPTAAVYVDREMWEKIVLNLMSNAFKFTLRGEIAVTLRQDGDSVCLTVRDTGAGIPVDELPRLFERFHRVKGTESRTHEGTGIGLALVQELVKLHGGKISVDSELGRGSAFRVTIPTGCAHLPAHRVQPDRLPTSSSSAASAYLNEALGWNAEGGAPAAVAEVPTHRVYVSTAGARILIVDDNRDMRDYLRRLLEPYWEIDTARDGQAALAAVRSLRPELVLSDVMMPVLDGRELLRAIREQPATCTLPVILLSARAGDEAQVEGLASGADDYITKPFSARELIARVNAHLELARTRREADRRKDEFLAMLAHELRNPLAPIRNAAQVLSQLESTEPRLEQCRAIIIRQVSHMTRLIDDLLDVSRITNGKIPLRKERLTVAEVAEAAVEAARPHLEHAQQLLSLSIADGLEIEGDRARLVQMITNLLVNAAKFSPVAGHINLLGQLTSNGVRISVRDTGIGISPEAQQRIFDLFVQEDVSLERSRGGLGIGLTLVKRLVELHGGTVQVRSDGVGQGAEFSLVLPSAAHRPGPAAE